MSGVVHRKSWHLPWQGEQVPHALLDITRRCTISCRSCYNTDDGEDKPLADVQAEIRQLSALRRLTSISIVGGEPTLHPDLPEIIGYIRSLGLHAELFTNGVLLDDAMASRLAQAGLEVAFLHIQTGQKRPDLPEVSSRSDRERLLEEKVMLLARQGIDAGLSITAYHDSLDELSWTIDCCLKMPGLNYLLVTLDRDVRAMPDLEGNILDGITCRDAARHLEMVTDKIDMTTMVGDMKRERGWLPFCYLGSNIDRADPRWVSYVAICAYEREGLKAHLSLRASLVEKLYLRLELAVKGRYPFFSRQRQGMLKLQLFLNSIFGGRFIANLAFLSRSFRHQHDVSLKKILFQSLAYVDADGRVVHCANCPDAVVKNGRLVPACISDRVRC